LKDCVQEDGKLYLVFEFLDKDLKKCMESCNGLLSPISVNLYLFQCCRGLAFCHARFEASKPSRDGRLKLADFGLARACCPPIRPLTHEVVTLWYRPPEILLASQTYAPPVNVWAIGVIFVEMVTSQSVRYSQVTLKRIERRRLHGCHSGSVSPQRNRRALHGLWTIRNPGACLVI
jgi:cyclin-dependent kinase 1